MLFRRLCILFAFASVLSFASAANASPFHSRLITDTYDRGQHGLLVKVHSYHKYSCRERRRKCNTFRYHDDFKRCMKDYGCPPDTRYHSKKRSYGYHGHKHHHHRHTHGDRHGYKYGRDYYRSYKDHGYGYPKKKRSCRDAHTRCVARWNSDPYTRRDWYSDYFGCMEYYRCSPKYYPRDRKRHYRKRHYDQDWKW